MAELYKITSPSGKHYLGISNKSATHRWKQHRYNASKNYGVGKVALYDAIRKYGADNFTVECLCIGSFEYIKALEVSAIKAYGTQVPSGYNLSAGGDGSVGVIVSAETRVKQSKAQKLRLLDPVQKQIALDAIHKANTIKQAKWWALTEEERNIKRSEHKVKLDAANRFTPEVRATISIKLKGVKQAPWTQERKDKLAASKRLYWTEERKRAMAEQKKLEWQNEDLRTKRIAGYHRYQQERKNDE